MKLLPKKEEIWDTNIIKSEKKKNSGYTYTSAILSYYYVLAILMCVVWNFTLSMVVNGLKIGIKFV